MKTQSDADDQVMTYVNAEVEKWKVRLFCLAPAIFYFWLYIDDWNF